MKQIDTYIIEKFKITKNIKLQRKILVIYEFNPTCTEVEDYDIYNSLEEAADAIIDYKYGRKSGKKRRTYYCAFSINEQDIQDLFNNICRLPAKKFDEEYCKEKEIEDVEKELYNLIKKKS